MGVPANERADEVSDGFRHGRMEAALSSENDYDYYHEEGFWRNQNIHRAMMSEKIEQLRYALTCAMTRIWLRAWEWT